MKSQQDLTAGQDGKQKPVNGWHWLLHSYTITSLAPNGKAINRKWEFDLVSGAQHQPSC